MSAKRRQFEREALPHIDALYAMALRLTRDEADAQDLVQDTMVKAFRFFHRYERGSNVKAWLFKVLVNLFYNERRKHKKNVRLQSDVAAVSPSNRFVSRASALGYRPEELLLDRISNARLRESLEQLSEEFRMAVVLCDLYDFSYKEIAEILEIPVGTVMSRLHRGRRQLRESLFTHALERGLIRDASTDRKAGLSDLEAYRRQKERA